MLKALAILAQAAATILALAGMTRLNFTITADGAIQGDAVPDGLRATILDVDEMVPCVGQGAIGIEIREQDEELMRDYCDVQIMLAASPLRPIARAAASA